MKVSELQRKDIVNINDGKIVGRIIDVLINETDGTLDGFVIERSKYIRSLFSSEEDTIIKFNQIKKLGPLENILKLLPGAKKMGLNKVNIDPKIMKRTEAIVLSMTPEERRNPSILKASRKKRIADGSGTTVTDVNKLLNQFEEMKKMMKMMGNGNFKMPF